VSIDSGAKSAGGPHHRAEWWAGGALLLVAVAMRIDNAIRYRTGNGFDAVENVEYVRFLTHSWALPDPEAAWATSHPPLFYYVAAALWRVLVGVGLEGALLVSLPLLASAAGLVAIGSAVWLVARLSPDDPRRIVLAGALLLFLPVHVYMAAMVGEELLATMWMSLALIAAAPIGQSPGAPAPARAAVVGLLAGLAVLTKMTGVLVLLAIGTTWWIAAWRSRRAGPALVASAVAGAVALGVGGWYYLYNLVAYGYLYPQDLAVHAKMFEMPPGSRQLLDYLRFPLAAFSDPQLLNPDLLRSVWGGTYDTVWFDGHRHFLPRSPAVTRFGSAITVLALLPTAAFVVGAGRAVRRAVRDPGGVDTLLLSTLAALLAGYVAFTWGNPWFATVKGSYLLGLSVPFAVYASEALAGWTRAGGWRSALVWGALVLLLVLIVLAFTIGPVFVKLDGPGLPWRDASP